MNLLSVQVTWEREETRRAEGYSTQQIYENKLQGALLINANYLLSSVALLLPLPKQEGTDKPYAHSSNDKNWWEQIRF